MKAFCIFSVILFLSYVPVSGQVGTGINLYAGGGITFPQGDSKDFWNSGFHVMLGASASPFPGLETVGRYARHTHSPESDKSDEDDFTVSEYGVDVRLNLTAPGFKFKPYALVGAGFARYDFTESSITDPASALVGLSPGTKFFYSIGGGVKVTTLPKINFFFQMRYDRIQVKNGNIGLLPITMGINLAL